MNLENFRKHLAGTPLEQAVSRAVDECIKEGILADFLSQNKAEAIEMSIFEYYLEAYMESVCREGYEDGLAAGREEGTAGSNKKTMERE